MAFSHLAPEFFRGTQKEDPNEWWEDMELWTTYRKLSEAEKLATFPLMLKDSAKTWHQQAASHQKDTFSHLKASFLEHFKRDASSRWKDLANVFDCKQGPDEGVEAFITQIKKKAVRAGINEEQLRHAIIKGLKPSIRQQVVSHDNWNIVQDIKRWTIFAENSDEPKTDFDAMFRRLEAKVDRLQVAGF